VTASLYLLPVFRYNGNKFTAAGINAYETRTQRWQML